MQKVFLICSQHVAFADLTSKNFFKSARRVLLSLPLVTKMYLCAVYVCVWMCMCSCMCLCVTTFGQFQRVPCKWENFSLKKRGRRINFFLTYSTHVEFAVVTRTKHFACSVREVYSGTLIPSLLTTCLVTSNLNYLLRYA